MNREELGRLGQYFINKGNSTPSYHNQAGAALVGIGEVILEFARAPDNLARTPAACSTCNGHGRVIEEATPEAARHQARCPKCGGSGREPLVVREREV